LQQAKSCAEAHDQAWPITRRPATGRGRSPSRCNRVSLGATGRAFEGLIVIGEGRGVGGTVAARQLEEVGAHESELSMAS
jgi:hypothetical protein